MAAEKNHLNTVTSYPSLKDVGKVSAAMAASSSEWVDFDYGTSSTSSGFYGSSYDAGSQPQPHFMTPAEPAPDNNFDGRNYSFDDEPPLLQELGINVEHIAQKTLTVLNPFRSNLRADVAGDADLAGPLAFCLAFGALLLLGQGKVHFNYIYGIGALGCVAMYALLTLMANSSSSTGVHLTVVVSVLGYCILPIVLLSAVSVVISLQGMVGNVAAVAAVLWCALSASKLFVTAFDMERQQLLVAYPCALLYAVFALITMF